MDGKSKKEEEKNKKGVVGREEVQNPFNYFLGAIPLLKASRKGAK